MSLSQNFLNNAVLPKNYTSPKQGQFTLRRLTSAHVKDCLQLQDDILQGLPANQTFLHVKDKKEYRNLALKKGFLVGAFETATGKLAAISAVRMPSSKKDDVNVLDMNLPANPKKLATIEGVMVAPHGRGHHLAEAMFNFATAALPKLGREHALAVITRENHFSWRTFLSAGFEITGAGFDPEDNSTVYYAHKDLIFGRSFHDVAPTATVTPALNLKDAKRLFDRGYRGVECDQNNQLKLRR